MTEEKSKSAVVFDLDLAFKPVVGPQDMISTLQQEALNRILGLIRRQIDQIVKPGSNSFQSTTLVVHNAILVSGSRGCGKSTFLHGLRAHGMLTPDSKGGGGSSVDIHWLPPFDPTLIEPGEHPLITLLSRLNEDVMNEKSHNKTDFEHYHVALRDVAESLHSLEGVGPKELYQGWEDPDIIVEDKLAKAASGAVLATRIDKLMYAAANVMGCKAFGVILDDVDTHFDRGWPVIEMLRRYLTSQRIVVVLAGDIDLYSKLVRAAQYRNLGSELLRYDRAHRDHHPEEDRRPWQDDRMKHLVDELESQYLMKVIRPENRVSLKTMRDLCPAISVEDPATVHLKSGGDDHGPLRGCLENILRHALNLKRQDDIREHVEAILVLPLRTVAQILRVGVLLLKKEPPKPEIINEFRRRFTDVASSSLLHCGIQPEDLISADGDELTRLIVNWTADSDLWDEGPSLRPRFADSHLNLTAMAFAMRAVTLFEQGIHEALRYLIRVGFTRMVVRQGIDRIEKEAFKGATRRELVQFLHLGSKQTLADFGRRLVVAQRKANDEDSVFMGTIKVVGGNRARTIAGALFAVYGPPPSSSSQTGKTRENWTATKFKTFAKSGKFEESRFGLNHWLHYVQSMDYYNVGAGFGYNTIDSIAARKGPYALANLIASRFQDRTRSSTCLSIIPILGAIGVAIEETTPLNRRATDNESESAALYRLTDIPTFMLGVSSDTKGESGDNKKDTTPNDDEDESEEAFSDESEPSNEWQQMLVPHGEDLRKAAFSSHPGVLADIADRYDMALRALDEGLRQPEYQAGYLLERQLLGFLNAVLVEELADGKGLIPDFKSVVTQENPYLRNLGILEVGPAATVRAPLHQVLVNTPAIHHFVRSNVEWQNEMKWSKGDTTKKWQIERECKVEYLKPLNGSGGEFKVNLWVLLNTVPVHSRTLRKNLLTEAKSTAETSSSADAKPAADANPVAEPSPTPST